MNQQLINTISGILHENESLTWDVTDDLARKILTALGADEERHIVRVKDGDVRGFTMQHPVHERLLGSLLDCDIHDEVYAFIPPETEDGEYFAERKQLWGIVLTKKEN